MSQRESDDHTAPEDAVDHARLARLVADNYTPPAPASSTSAKDAPELTRRVRRSAVIAPAPTLAAQRAQPVPQPAAFAASSMPAPKAARSSPLLLVGCAVVLLLFLGGFVGWMLFSKPMPIKGPPGPTPIQGVDVPHTVPPDAPDLEMMSVPGGAFRMGRDDAPPTVLNESPSHMVTLRGFMMGRTEVTNAEYAEFVRATGRPAPSGEAAPEGEQPWWKPWSGGRPPEGQERWPVRNVTLNDAVAFASWRSKRDGVAYRLPTEAEWEYAARSHGTSGLYPWGEAFANERANVDAELPRPVGSYPGGASREGVLDLIGNVWEWTSSDAAPYPGNRDIEVRDKGMKVARGGSYQSKGRGGAAVTATSRIFIRPETKHPTLGFRLVRDGS
jgi:formylglycine-generating enzyme required for sulfatase activity